MNARAHVVSNVGIKGERCVDKAEEDWCQEYGQVPTPTAAVEPGGIIGTGHYIWLPK